MTDRELAVAVARAVGWTATGTGEPYDTTDQLYGWPPGEPSDPTLGPAALPNYPTDLNAAWEAARTQGKVVLETDQDGNTGAWILLTKARLTPTGYDKNPARALCLAIVKAAEEK